MPQKSYQTNLFAYGNKVLRQANVYFSGTLKKKKLSKKPPKAPKMYNCIEIHFSVELSPPLFLFFSDAQGSRRTDLWVIGDAFNWGAD